MTRIPEDPLAVELHAHFALEVGVEAMLPLVRDVGDLLCETFRRGGRLYTFGNGGSAADAQHLAAEFVGRFRRERRPLPAVSLVTDASVTSCISNDYAAEDVFARQVEALAVPGDVVAGFTTSGRSPNVVRGLRAARERGATTVLFAAGAGDEAAQHADHQLLVPAAPTARVQEMHLLLLHLVSEVVDDWAGAGRPAPAAPADVARA